MSHWKLSERTQLFSSLSCTKFYCIDIDEIPEFLFRKHNIFTKRGERSTYLFACADKTRFGKMAVYFSRRAFFIYHEHQAWFQLKFRWKIYLVIIFYVKIKVSCPRAKLPCRCHVHLVFFVYILNCIWSKRAIINGKITWLNFTWF